MPKSCTTIAIRRDTAERLGKIGYFNESYDDVIRRLLDSGPYHQRKAEDRP